MTPSEKEKIIKDSYDAIKDLYILRNELLTDAGKLEAAKESNRKLSDRVANLEVTIKSLNAAIDKKDAEIRDLKATTEAFKRKWSTNYDDYLALCRKCDSNENIMRQMIADSRKKKDEIKSLREELEAEKKSYCCDGCGSIRRIEALKKGCEENRKVAEKYKSEIAELESNFHELRHRLGDLCWYLVLDKPATKDIKAFVDWFKGTFGDFGVNDEEE